MSERIQTGEFSKNAAGRRGLALLALVSAAGWLAFAPACSRKPASNREVWAQVDGAPVYRDQVERYYRNRAPGSDTGGEEQALNFKLNILNQLIDNQILLKHAAESQIAVSDAEVDKRIEQLRSPYSAEEFQKKVKDQGMTLDDLREEVRQALTIDKLINKDITSHINVAQPEIEKYYAANKASFNVAETQFHLAQILVTPGPDRQTPNLKNSDAKSRAEALRKIRSLYLRLRAGEDFAKLASEYSEDPRTAPGGGDMGFIPASSLASERELRLALNGLKPGQVSPIFRDTSGYHIIKLLGREDAGQRALSNPQVESTIRQTLISDKEQLLKAAYIEDLRNRAAVKDYLAERIAAAHGDPAGVE
ncbi:MAG TPA: peptidylprolyl isomerase [Terriglobia bacterium]|nr:peptidylprolyl isomerase [Terriglobia bacterium]